MNKEVSQQSSRPTRCELTAHREKQKISDLHPSNSGPFYRITNILWTPFQIFLLIPKVELFA